MPRRIRVVIAFAVLACLPAIDFWYIKRPEPHSVAEFSPFTAKLGAEELVISEPGFSTDPLLAHQGGQDESVDIFFDKGILSSRTRELLKSFQWAQSTEPQQVSYTTLEASRKGSPCRTFVRVSSDKAVGEILVFQRDLTTAGQHREIETAAIGSSLTVDFLTSGDEPDITEQPGCKKLLQVGPYQVQLSGIPVQVQTDAGSSVRMKFLPTSDQKPIWEGGQKGLFDPFPSLNLSAQSVTVSSNGSADIIKKVSASNSKAPIQIESLVIGPQEIKVGVSGVGMVTIKGNLVGPTLSEWFQKSPWRAGITGFLNLFAVCAALYYTRRRLPKTLEPVDGPGPGPSSQKLVVFLCHCSENKQLVRNLHQLLRADGFDPWLDEEDIFPARPWSYEIDRALRASHAVIVCLSKVFEHKEGFVRKELRHALDIAEEKVYAAAYLLPVRLEECLIPPELKQLQCIDLYQPAGYNKLKMALEERLRQLRMGPSQDHPVDAGGLFTAE